MTAERCDAVTRIGPVLLRCTERYGHTGQHFARIIVNGTECETGWRDTDARPAERELRDWPRCNDGTYLKIPRPAEHEQGHR